MVDLIKTVYPELRRIVCHLAGKVLTGKSVEFRFKYPPFKVNGLVFKDGTEGAVVFVDPDLDDGPMLKTILHELSHVKLDYPKLMDIKNIKKLDGLYLSETKRLPSSRESMAKCQAAKWLDIADRLKPGGDYLQKLNALIRHYSEG